MAINPTPIVPPAIEPITVAEAMQWGRIDASSAEPAPGLVTAALASPAAPGNVDNGAHRYLATFVTATGETEAGAISAAVTVADKTVNGQVALTGIPTGGSLVTSRKLYRTTAGGSSYLLLATLADNTTSVYTDNTADSGLGAGAPVANTTVDPLINLLITAARRQAEERTGRALITQTRELVYDQFPASEMRIGMLPIQSIVSVSYYDSEGTLTTLPVDDYTLDVVHLPGWLLPAYDTSWPATYHAANGVIVHFVAGYGSARADVPAEIRAWICAQVAAAFNNPSGLLDGKTVPLQFLDGLLDTYSILDIA